MKNCQTEATFFEHLLSINVLAAYVCVRASHNDALLLGGRSRLINKMSALVLFFFVRPSVTQQSINLNFNSDD